MWSGPRNISTAMLRAWENRPDSFVVDEPLYAHYLLATGHTDHPGYDDTLRAHDTNWRRVAAWLTGPIPGGRDLFYQKHMAHHLLPGMDSEWAHRLTNVFLIREPGEMLSSLAEFLPSHGAAAASRVVRAGCRSAGIRAAGDRRAGCAYRSVGHAWRALPADRRAVL
jgi:hypothetical protein